MPGSVRDAALLQVANPEVSIVALDLLGVGPDQVDLVNSVTEICKGHQVHLVGFSIGAMPRRSLAWIKGYVVAAGDVRTAKGIVGRRCRFA
jgi:pimeloyl-ACP methyl ester carboxylesterase